MPGSGKETQAIPREFTAFTLRVRRLLPTIQTGETILNPQASEQIDQVAVEMLDYNGELPFDIIETAFSTSFGEETAIVFPDAWNANSNIKRRIQIGEEPTIDPRVVSDTARNILRLTIARKLGLYQTEDAKNTITAQLALLQGYAKNNASADLSFPLGAVEPDTAISSPPPTAQ